MAELLVRTPAPRAREALIGYTLRVSEANGYEHLWHLGKLVGVTRQCHRLTFPLAELAGVLGRPLSQLEPLGYRVGSGDSLQYQLLGHELGRSMRHKPLRISVPAFCPACVEEQGYIDAFWDLSIAAACPVHGKHVLRRCPTCEQPLQWSRPGLLVCRCGASLAQPDLEPADPSHLAVMAVLRGKLYGIDPGPRPRALGFPVDALTDMPMGALLYTIEMLGRYVFQARGALPDTRDQGVTAAAQALASWPDGYYRFLSALGEKLIVLNPDAVGLCRQFQYFYDVMFRSRHLGAATGFLHEEFLRFGQLHWGRGLVDPRFVSGDGEGQERYVPKAEFARRHRLWQPTLTRLIKAGAVVTKTVGTGKGRRTLIDVRESVVPRELSESLPEREAARYLGLSVGVLKHLRQSGVYRQRLSPGRPVRWQVADLDEFMTRARASAVGASADGAVTESGDLAVELREVLAHWLRDVPAKAEVVVAALDGGIEVLGHDGSDVGGILLRRSEVETMVAGLKAKPREDSIETYPAARRTGLRGPVMEDAVTRGLLNAMELDGSVRITLESVDRFNQTYVALMSLASRLGTTSRSLSRACGVRGIPVISLKCKAAGPSQPIVQRDWEAKILAAWRDTVRNRASDGSSSGTEATTH